MNTKEIKRENSINLLDNEGKSHEVSENHYTNRYYRPENRKAYYDFPTCDGRLEYRGGVTKSPVSELKKE